MERHGESVIAFGHMATLIVDRVTQETELEQFNTWKAERIEEPKKGQERIQGRR